MTKKELEAIKEVEQKLWEIKLWAGEDAKNITSRLWIELVDIIEKYKKEAKE